MALKIWSFLTEMVMFCSFLNDGIPGESSYRFAPKFINNFPKIVNWMLLRDYNGDGIEDIFAYPLTPGISGVEVYKGFCIKW
ncbi:MAG: hypothetical protein R2769_10800 [Saprospiraceae bacterium]